jgi:hypothetical protein
LGWHCIWVLCIGIGDEDFCFLWATPVLEIFFVAGTRAAARVTRFAAVAAWKVFTKVAPLLLAAPVLVAAVYPCERTQASIPNEGSFDIAAWVSSEVTWNILTGRGATFVVFVSRTSEQADLLIHCCNELTAEHGVDFPCFPVQSLVGVLAAWAAVEDRLEASLQIMVEWDVLECLVHSDVKFFAQFWSEQFPGKLAICHIGAPMFVISHLLSQFYNTRAIEAAPIVGLKYEFLFGEDCVQRRKRVPAKTTISPVSISSTALSTSM